MQRGKRTHSDTKTPSPQHPANANSFSPLQEPDEAMDPASLQHQIRSALRDALEDVVQEIPGAVISKSPGENPKKKKKGNSSQSGSTSGTQGLTASSNLDGDDKLAEKIANQVLTGLLPKLTVAITGAINSVVQAIVDQAANATLEKVGQVVQSQALLQRYETDRLEQYSRRWTVRITGLPEPPNETNEQLTDNLLNLFKDCGTDVKAEDISVCHRNGPRKFRDQVNTKRPILCQFVSRNVKSDVLKRRKTLKTFGADENDGPKYKNVYLNEDLTPLRAKLHTIVREQPCIANTTTQHGRILCWLKDKPGDQKPVVVDSPEDLFKLGMNSLDYNRLGLKAFLFPTTLNQNQ